MAGPRTQTISVVRHADAGQRERFVGDDSMRPLSRRGRREADSIGRRLEETAVELVSSPYLRCIETLSPLSSRLRRAIELVPALAEGESPAGALAYLLGALGDRSHLVSCTHGDVLGGVIERCARGDASFSGPAILAKGSTTELTVLSGRVVAVAFVPPPTR